MPMEPTPDQRTAAEIRAEMARQRRKQSELARHLGLTQPSISVRLRGEVGFSITELYATARFLGRSPTDFLPADDVAVAT